MRNCRMRLRPNLALIILLLLGASGSAAPPSEPADSKTAVETHSGAQPADYLIGPDDVLAVNVWKEPEISRSVPVRPDGKISLPLVGELVASGHTTVELQDAIKGQLLKYVSHPAVTVIVEEAKSQKFNVVGEVERPGSYPLSTPMTVLDGIAVAGGFRDFAKTSKIYVLRVNEGSRIRLPFNYKKVIKGYDFQQNVELKPRDTIVVP
jgi:polysaccharide export outer membrane protein